MTTNKDILVSLNGLLAKVEAIEAQQGKVQQAIRAEDQRLAQAFDQARTNGLIIVPGRQAAGQDNIVVQLPDEIVLPTSGQPNPIRFGNKTVYIPNCRVTGLKDAVGKLANLQDAVVTLRLGAKQIPQPDGTVAYQLPTIQAKDRLAVLVSGVESQTYFTGERELTVKAAFADLIARYNPQTKLHEGVSPRQNVWGGFNNLNATGSLTKAVPVAQVVS